MVVVLMGVAGSGKSTVGRILAHKLGWEFHDADELHPRSNVEKMRRGVALSDEDRWPWLDAVRALIDQCLARGASAVIACSALKQAYRERLVADPTRVKIVYLKGTRELIAERLAARSGDFFNHELLRSQFDTLEEPRDAITVDVTANAGTLADAIAAQLEA